MKAVDTDGDGRISYNGQPSCHHTSRRSTSADIALEFRTFVEETEKELLALFRSIDYNRDGKISRDELRAALSRAGLAVPNSSLDNFFTEVDTNNDGTISFEEWRYDPHFSNLRLEPYCRSHFRVPACRPRPSFDDCVFCNVTSRESWQFAAWCRVFSLLLSCVKNCGYMDSC